MKIRRSTYFYLRDDYKTAKKSLTGGFRKAYDRLEVQTIMRDEGSRVIPEGVVAPHMLHFLHPPHQCREMQRLVEQDKRQDGQQSREGIVGPSQGCGGPQGKDGKVEERGSGIQKCRIGKALSACLDHHPHQEMIAKYKDQVGGCQSQYPF